VGTEGAAADAYIEDIGNGWYRCMISFTATAASNTMQIAAATADGDATFAGDGSAISVHFWGAQLETGAYATSYIPTTSASVTRAADILRYDGIVLSPPYTVETSVLLAAGGAIQSIVDLDGGTGTAYLTYITSADRAGLFVQNSSATQANITDGDIISIGEWTSISTVGAIDDMRILVDSAPSGTPDVSGTPPDVTTVSVGVNRSSGQAMISGFIGPIKIYDEVVEP